MASDKNGFVSCSALCAGALVKLNSNGNFYHKNDYIIYNGFLMYCK